MTVEIMPVHVPLSRKATRNIEEFARSIERWNGRFGVAYDTRILVKSGQEPLTDTEVAGGVEHPVVVHADTAATMTAREVDRAAAWIVTGGLLRGLLELHHPEANDASVNALAAVLVAGFLG